MAVYDQLAPLTQFADIPQFMRPSWFRKRNGDSTNFGSAFNATVPALTTIAGTFLGGPAGTALGSAIGQGIVGGVDQISADQAHKQGATDAYNNIENNIPQDMATAGFASQLAGMVGYSPKIHGLNGAPDVAGKFSLYPPDGANLPGLVGSGMAALGRRPTASVPRGSRYQQFADGGPVKPVRKSFADYYKTIPREKNDTLTYNLRDAYASDPVSAERFAADPNFHLDDTYKLPNHITFSENSKYSTLDHPGGRWAQSPNGKWSFTPSPWNLQQHSPKELKSYFDRYEKGNRLMLNTAGFADGGAPMGTLTKKSRFIRTAPFRPFNFGTGYENGSSYSSPQAEEGVLTANRRMQGDGTSIIRPQVPQLRQPLNTTPSANRMFELSTFEGSGSANLAEAQGALSMQSGYIGAGDNLHYQQPTLPYGANMPVPMRTMVINYLNQRNRLEHSAIPTRPNRYQRNKIVPLPQDVPYNWNTGSTNMMADGGYMRYHPSDKVSEDILMHDKRTGKKVGEMRYGERIYDQHASDTIDHAVKLLDMAPSKEGYEWLGKYIHQETKTHKDHARHAYAGMRTQPPVQRDRNGRIIAPVLRGVAPESTGRGERVGSPLDILHRKQAYLQQQREDGRPALRSTGYVPEKVKESFRTAQAYKEAEQKALDIADKAAYTLPIPFVGETIGAAGAAIGAGIRGGRALRDIEAGNYGNAALNAGEAGLGLIGAKAPKFLGMREVGVDLYNAGKRALAKTEEYSHPLLPTFKEYVTERLGGNSIGIDRDFLNHPGNDFMRREHQDLRDGIQQAEQNYDLMGVSGKTHLPYRYVPEWERAPGRTDDVASFGERFQASPRQPAPQPNAVPSHTPTPAPERPSGYLSPDQLAELGANDANYPGLSTVAELRAQSQLPPPPAEVNLGNFAFDAPNPAPQIDKRSAANWGNFPQRSDDVLSFADFKNRTMNNNGGTEGIDFSGKMRDNLSESDYSTLRGYLREDYDKVRGSGDTIAYNANNLDPIQRTDIELNDPVGGYVSRDGWRPYERSRRAYAAQSARAPQAVTPHPAETPGYGTAQNWGGYNQHPSDVISFADFKNQQANLQEGTTGVDYRSGFQANSPENYQILRQHLEDDYGYARHGLNPAGSLSDPSQFVNPIERGARQMRNPAGGYVTRDGLQPYSTEAVAQRRANEAASYAQYVPPKPQTGEAYAEDLKQLGVSEKDVETIKKVVKSADTTGTIAFNNTDTANTYKLRNDEFKVTKDNADDVIATIEKARDLVTPGHPLHKQFTRSLEDAHSTKFLQTTFQDELKAKGLNPTINMRMVTGSDGHKYLVNDESEVLGNITGSSADFPRVGTSGVALSYHGNTELGAQNRVGEALYRGVSRGYKNVHGKHLGTEAHFAQTTHIDPNTGLPVERYRAKDFWESQVRRGNAVPRASGHGYDFIRALPPVSAAAYYGSRNQDNSKGFADGGILTNDMDYLSLLRLGREQHFADGGKPETPVKPSQTIRDAQQKLKNAGLYEGPVDGLYTAAVDVAVKHWNGSTRMMPNRKPIAWVDSADDYVHDVKFDKSRTENTKPPASVADVAITSKAQAQLKKDGLYTGPIHGKLDEATMNAIYAHNRKQRNNPTAQYNFGEDDNGANHINSLPGESPVPGPAIPTKTRSDLGELTVYKDTKKPPRVNYMPTSDEIGSLPPPYEKPVAPVKYGTDWEPDRSTVKPAGQAQTKPAGYDWLSVGNVADAARAFVGYTQASRDLPEHPINPDYLSLVGEARGQRNEGLGPASRKLFKDEIDDSRSLGINALRANLGGGGSAGATLAGLDRVNDATSTAALKLAAADEQARSINQNRYQSLLGGQINMEDQRYGQAFNAALMNKQMGMNLAQEGLSGIQQRYDVWNMYDRPDSPGARFAKMQEDNAAAAQKAASTAYSNTGQILGRKSILP